MLKILILSCCVFAVLSQDFTDVTTDNGDLARTSSSVSDSTATESDSPKRTTTLAPINTDTPNTNPEPTTTVTAVTNTEPSTTTTSTEPSTVEPTTVAPNGYEDVNITIEEGNTTCLQGMLAMKFDIPYKDTNKTEKTVTVYVPKDNTITEKRCNTSEGNLELTLSWPQYNLTLTFGKSGDNAELIKLVLSYNISGADFPNAEEKGIKITDVVNATIFSSSLKSNYKCSSPQTFSLTNGTVTFKDVSLTMFAQESKDRTESVCALDDTTSDIVPIAVGCALVGLVIIVIIAYLVGRRRSRQKGYQSV